MFTCNLCDNHHICATCYNDTIVEETIHSRKSLNYPAEHPHMHHSYRLDMSPFGKREFFYFFHPHLFSVQLHFRCMTTHVRVVVPEFFRVSVMCEFQSFSFFTNNSRNMSFFSCPEICPDYGICATCFIKKKGSEEIELFEAVQANPKLEKKYQIGAAIVTQKYYGIGLARLDWFQIHKDDEVEFKSRSKLTFQMIPGTNEKSWA